MLSRLTFVLFIASSVLVADDAGFQKLTPSINKFRGGSGGEVSIRFNKESFQVGRVTKNMVGADQAKALLPKDPTFPTLKISEDGNWFGHEVNRDIELDEPVMSNGEPDVSRQWRKWSREDLGSFARDEWPRFIEFAIANGLSGVEEIKFKGRSSFTLSFSPLTPKEIGFGNRTLQLTPEFRSVMRLSPKYPAKAGDKGFVILLHDPHENVAGRFQTLSGLHSIISANPTVKFRFLVEGAYEGTSRVIGFSGLDAILAPGADTTPFIVQSLLSRYLINTPLAYRLLYDRTINAYAIDNNALLTYPAPRPIRTFAAQSLSLQRISATLEKAKLPSEASQAKTNVENIVATAFIYLAADLRDAPDSALLGYYDTLAKLYRSISEISGLFSKIGVSLSPPDVRALAADALGCADEAAIYKKALERNDTMAPQIIRAATSGTDLPVAFIGNYHTHGIISELSKASIGYVVIEPRPRVPTSEREHDEFDRANHVNTRRDYIANVPLNMGYNAPTRAEVDTVYAPKISAKALTFRAKRLAFRNEFKAIVGSSVDVDRLTSSINNNGSLAAVKVASGGNAPPPPGDFGKAFAYFDPGDPGGGGPRFVVTDPKEQNWSNNDRYFFLSVALFKAPERRSADIANGVLLALYPDSTSRRLFFTFYEPKSKRIYCFEGKPTEAASLVPIPLGDDKGEQNVRTQVVQLIIIRKAVNHG